MGPGLSERDPRRRPTLRDVARRAGVHPATASRALNPDLPGRTSAHTSRLVHEAAAELGYVPDPAARSLRTRRSGVVGVVVPDLTNPVLPPMIRRIEETMWEAGLACLLADTDNLPDREEALIDQLRARRCEGLIIASASRRSAAVMSLAEGDIPTVLVTREPDDSPLPFVAGDDATGVETAVDHIVDLGHEAIAYLTGPTELSTTLHREKAFRRAIGQRLPGQEPVIIHGDGFTVEAGRKTAGELGHRLDRVTAILAGNDMMALGVYEAMTVEGKRCPADISVVGHNDMPFMRQVTPPLTTVATPRSRVGTEAAEMLLALREGRDAQPTRRLLPTTLVVRESTGPPPT